MSKSNDCIIAKMKKLLAMSESKVNEHEAMAAARQLHAMLAKHNICISKLHEEDDPINQEGFESNSRPRKKLTAQAIARLYFCEFYSQNTHKGKCIYMFVGSEANRVFANHITKLVTTSIERDARKESRKQYGKEVCGFVNSFWTGAMQRITQRCEELKIQAEEGTLVDEEGTTLPAMLSTYERNNVVVQDWLSENLNLKTKNSRTRVTNIDGLSKGREAGNRVQLSRSIQGKAAPKLLT